MRVLDDYSFVRGVCHGPRENDPETWKREFGYMNRLQLNSVRMWLSQQRWEEEGDAYLDMIVSFIRMGREMGITAMPILWNGNYINEFTPLTEDEWSAKERYAKAFIDALKDEPGLLMWDVINEPLCNKYIMNSPPEELEERRDNLTYYTRRLCEIVKKLDPVNAITVGFAYVYNIHRAIDLVDVVSFHDYLHTRNEVEQTILTVKKLAADAGNKPILNTETGCIGRANPYDVELELCGQYKIGWYLFNLICRGPWSDIHGIVYPNGTVRDPAIISAILGFYRNRTEDRILANPNREKHAFEAIKRMENVLHSDQSFMHTYTSASSDELLEAVEYIVNLLEAAEMVPMWDLPSARIAVWRKQPAEKRNIREIRAFCYEMMNLLKKSCLI